MDQLKRFFYRNSNQFVEIANELSYDDQNKLEKWNITKTYSWHNSLHYIKESDVGKLIYRVNFHQFRVTIATILYDKGYHLDWIREHMNHLSTEMTEHYIRLDELRKLEQNITETLLKRSNESGSALMTSDNQISDRYIKEELINSTYIEAYDRINKFLKKNKFNIHKDMNKIIEILSRTDNSIMDMELGICAKSLNKLCKRHKYISSIQDAYFIGVQIPSIDDLEYSYKRYGDKVSIIKHNEKLFLNNPKYKNELEREFRGLHLYIERKLFIELDLLYGLIIEMGSDNVIKIYPNLKSLVCDFDNINREVLMWKEKKLKID